MMSSHFDSLPVNQKYKGYTISLGDLYIYQDDVEIYCHRGYGVYTCTNYHGFRFTKEAAKAFINHLEETCPV